MQETITILQILEMIFWPVIFIALWIVGFYVISIPIIYVHHWITKDKANGV